MDVYEKNGVTQVFLLHIPENMARLLGGATDFNFIDEAMGNEKSLVEVARESLNQKMKQEVHPRSLDKEWCNRMEAPVGLDNDNQPVPLEPIHEFVDGVAIACQRIQENEALKWGLIDTEGNHISEFKYGYVEAWGEGYYKCEIGNKR